MTNKDTDYLTTEYNEKNYPLIFTRLRENILNWYPFRDDGTLLQIYAGYGEISSMLCRQCKGVTCVEPNKEQSNVLRNRLVGIENVELITDEFQSISEFNLAKDSRYDYVILDLSRVKKDVLSQHLLWAKRYLSPNGVLLLLAENGLNMNQISSYEDEKILNRMLGREHLDYKPYITKQMLTDEVLSAGFVKNRFYYPYPDLIAPSEVFTDDSFEGMGYGRPKHHFGGDRFVLSGANTCVNLLKNEDIQNRFVAAFMVECMVTDVCENENEIYYVKLSTDRANEFAIGTTILQNQDGNKRVLKSAMTKESRSHIRRLLDYNDLGNSEYYYLAAKRDDTHSSGYETVAYEFLNEATYDSYFYSLMKTDGFEEFAKQYVSLCEKLFEEQQEFDEASREGFERVFGPYRDDRNYMCIRPANVDLIFDNLYLVDDKICIIDGEWTYDFHIPIRFLQWRMIREWYEKHPDLEEITPKSKLHQWLKIDEEDQEIFLCWALHFAYDYVGCEQLRDYYGQTIVVDEQQFALINSRSVGEGGTPGLLQRVVHKLHRS